MKAFPIKKCAPIAATAATVLLLVGCGDDAGNGPSHADQIVARFDELSACTAKQEGTVAYVKDERVAYVCESGRWKPDEGGTSSAGTSSSSEAASSSGGETTLSSAETASSISEETMSSSAEEVRTVAGVAQKGPFANGSTVIVRELEDGTFAQTGRSFQGPVSGGQGGFSVSGVPLASRYALFEANGRYWNENTGAESNGPIALNALVDLSGRESANINLLTHLESERVLHLVSTGKSFAAAKKQAETEVFAAFGFAGDSSGSETLDIFSSGKANASLLAISVLLLGNLSEAELSERLADFANDIRQDGRWDNAAAKAQMADWANAADLAIIRANVESLDIGEQAPAFEPAIKNFWWNIYGLGACTATNDGEIKQDTNSLSANRDIYYICSAGEWREATLKEYDTYGKTCADDAELVSGAVIDANRYVCDADTFRTATDLEMIANRGCTSYNLNEEILVAGYAVCSSSGEWRASTRTVAGTMTDSRDGGTTYKTIGIGMQMWMAENLNYEYKVDGSTFGNWCYNDSAQYCAQYGRLYTWAAAMDSATTGCGDLANCAASSGRARGICPTGWHLPSDAEWNTLLTAVGDSAGTKLKSTLGWCSNGNGTDAFGFSALPSGRGGDRGYFLNAGCEALFWSSSEYNPYYVYYMYLGYSLAYADPNYLRKHTGIAVRCLRD